MEYTVDSKSIDVYVDDACIDRDHIASVYFEPLPFCCGVYCFGEFWYRDYTGDVDNVYRSIQEGLDEASIRFDVNKFVFSDAVENSKNRLSLMGLAQYLGAQAGNVVPNPRSGNHIQVFEYDIE